MSITIESFTQRLDRLSADLVEQGRRVERMVERAVEAIFRRDRAEADWVIEHDATIDRADIEIERAAVELLTEAARSPVDLAPDQLRAVLMVVKVNNELERSADLAVDMAEEFDAVGSCAEPAPQTFRVMANSVIGILQDSVTAFENKDHELAQKILRSDDTVLAFKGELLRDAQRRLGAGEISVECAFALHTVANTLQVIDDHCANVAEQVIYIATGAIVRHTGGKWSGPYQPD